MIAQETVTGQGTFDLPNLGPTIVAGATGVGLLWAAGLAFWDLADDKNARYQGTDLGKPDARPAFDGAAYAKTLPGIYAAVAPGMKGMWDPLGFCSKSDITKEKVDFYRDAETKHGRLGMLATVGILASESYHPVGGADLDGTPAVFALGKQ